MGNIDFEPQVGRRAFLEKLVKLGATVAAATLAGSQLWTPGLVEAAPSQDLIIKPTQVRSSKYWWPLNDRIAESKGLPTMHAPGWILYEHDRLSMEIFNTDPNTRAWGKALSESFMNSSDRDLRESAGFCNASTASFLLEPDPGESRFFRGVRYSREWLEGFLVGNHRGDLMIPVPVTPELVVAALQNDLPLMVEWPFNWYRAVNRTDGVRAWVTAFGNPDIPVGIHELISAFIIRPNDDNEPVSLAVKAAADANRIPGWNPEITRMLLAEQVI